MEKTWQENIYLGRIRRMALDFLAGEKAQVYLFGSWARGMPQRSSDVDLAIDYGDVASNRQKIAGLRELLEESTIPYRVDVVDMQQASAELCGEIRKDGILWRD